MTVISEWDVLVNVEAVIVNDVVAVVIVSLFERWTEYEGCQSASIHLFRIN